MKVAMFYEVTPDSMAMAHAHYPAHRARIDAFHARGLLLMVGPFMDANGGAMGVFTTREAAEEFIADDPFILHGVVVKWTLRDWKEVLV